MRKIAVLFALIIVFTLIPAGAEENDNHIYYWNFNGHGREMSDVKLDIYDYETMTYTDGKLSKALDLTNGDAVVNTDYVDTKFEKFTMAMWVYMDENYPSTANFQIVMAKDAKLAGHFEIFFMQVGEKYQLRIYAHDLGEAIGSEVLSDVGQWMHIAATFDGTYLRLYLNGEKVAEKAHSNGLDTSTESCVINIGSLVEGGFNFYGKIDEAILANYAFDEELIAKLCNNPEEGANTIKSLITAGYPEGQTPRPDVTPTPEPTPEPTPTVEPTKGTQGTPTVKPNTPVKKADNNLLIPIIVIATVVIAVVILVIIFKPGKKKN